MRRPFRSVCVLGIVAVLLLAQVHVWVEARPASAHRHACQVCLVGGWAILSAGLGLEAPIAALRLEIRLVRAIEMNRQATASAPRAPPLA